ncbi:hypothetical protein H0H93_008608 [Arthromyces matolae]|nr:hypothetical protein H0H93_008608 [Arthromyces matolae]
MMKFGGLLLGIALASAQICAAGVVYCEQDVFEGEDFFKGWTWETQNDPTHGRVNYVDQLTAQSLGLSSATDDKFFMRADSSSMIPPSARGRDSVRIISNKAYGDSVIVLDVQHMPAGCGTWPAFWTLSQAGPWPHGGEIDIIEAKLFLQIVTLKSILTKAAEQALLARTHTVLASITSVAVGIKVWFWARNDRSVPPEITYNLRFIEPSFFWGTPDAYFPTRQQCEYSSHFDEHRMVFDLTFCIFAASHHGLPGRGIGQVQFGALLGVGPELAMLVDTPNRET